ncbi:MAG: DNA-processing protein DprA [Bacteroidales bacterium]|nr:DNA-processing protein DprA [Bacteroidales bacterium]
MNNELLKYKIALGLIPGLGPVTAKSVISYTGGVKEVFEATKSQLMKAPGIGSFTASKVIEGKSFLKQAEKEIRFIEKNKIKPVFYLDKDYPFLLKQCPDAPLMIFVKGNIDFNNRKIISIVGTRDATIQGKEICENLIKSLSETSHNPIIISGLAYGIDICAHKAALKYGLDTVSVFAHGFDKIYPANHKKTATEIKEKGALITEFISGSKFERQNFLRRNRIIAGLSQATVVVESAKKGGSLVTADIANSYNREVFAVPGRLEDKYSEGTNWLIKTHKAFLLQTAADIEYILNWEQSNNKINQKSLFIELSEDEKELFKVLSQHKKIVIDEICKTLNMNMSKVSSLLLEMEFKGAVRSLPGKIYEPAGNINI